MDKLWIGGYEIPLFSKPLLINFMKWIGLVVCRFY